MEMASTTSRPMPGRLNTVSVITTPPIKRAMPMPITVTIGTPALFRACLNSNGPVATKLVELLVAKIRKQAGI